MRNLYRLVITRGKKMYILLLKHKTFLNFFLYYFYYENSLSFGYYNGEEKIHFCAQIFVGVYLCT